MVPLALQYIFKQSKGKDHKFSRSFHLSIFEIYSERGKGEKICDLIPERVESGLHSTVKGVQEVVVSNASEAESLIACAMLKRATVMTNTNSQLGASFVCEGAKLLESSFINNTSMVFGLCLRALLEHQKNPKKPLQKHFQNSLILIVKPGEEDYLDIACLLRQASPYMKIKFNNTEDPSGFVSNKRPTQSLSRIG